MPDGGTIVGGISKLRIERFEKPDCTGQNDGEMSVLINPETYSQRFAVKLSCDETIGGTGENQVAARELPDSLSLDLVFDGTGAVPSLKRTSVAEQVEALRNLGLPGKDRKFKYLLITWGVLRFKCRLKSLDISYTLFNPDGTPLRAKAKATFVGSHQSNPAPATPSPLLAEGSFIEMKDGDTIEAMCALLYGEVSYLVDVAAANGLDSLAAAAGQTLFFPAKTALGL